MHVAFERAAALRRAGALFFSALTEERALQTLRANCKVAASLHVKCFCQQDYPRPHVKAETEASSSHHPRSRLVSL